jgi:hydroxyproline O-galactosyltransferase 2/3/4/5/6
VQNLLTLCTTAECDAERSYIGNIRTGSIIMDPTHRWHNAAYLSHTGGGEYLPYAAGGGYILSLDAVNVLIELHQTVSLLFTPIEDATVGLWLAGMNVTIVDWAASMITVGSTCCFRNSKKKCALTTFCCFRDSLCPCLDVASWDVHFCWASAYRDGPAPVQM